MAASSQIASNAGGTAMRKKLMLTVTFITLLAAHASGQTAADIEAKYGKPVSAYSVNESVWMTPEYAADGQVCRMRLYPKRFFGNTNYLAKDLPFSNFKYAVDALVPLGERGAKKGAFGKGLWVLTGGVTWASFEYERVTITYLKGVRIDPNALRDLKSDNFPPEDFPVADIKPPAAERPGDEFLGYEQSRAEMVTITWNGRGCAGPVVAATW